MLTKIMSIGVTALFLAVVPNINCAKAEQAADFSQKKAKHIRITQQEITILNEYLSCATNAADEQGMILCGERKHLKLKELRLDEKERAREH